MNTGAERWTALRDREALGEVLRDDELTELHDLERSNPTARRFAGQMQELESLVHGHAGDAPGETDRLLVERALDSVQVTSQPLRTRSGDPDADVESAIDPEGPGWIRTGSIGLSVLLALGAIVALGTYEPTPVPQAGTSPGSGTAALAPTVEALTSARVAKPGNRLRRANKQLAAGATVSAGDVLRAAERPGCFVIEPSTTVCLAPLAAVRLTGLALKASTLEVLEGRVIATHEGRTGKLELAVGAVRVSAQDAVFGIEHGEDERSLMVRVLHGQAHVSSPFGARDLAAQQLGALRRDVGTFEVSSLPDAQAQRDWELRATAILPSQR